MKKIILGVIVVAFLLFLYLFGFLDNVNIIFPQNPDISCTVDSDCSYRISPLCDSCAGSEDILNLNGDKIIAVNKNWHAFCPFPDSPLIRASCALPIVYHNGVDITEDFLFNSSKYSKCIHNTCQKVLK